MTEQKAKILLKDTAYEKIKEIMMKDEVGFTSENTLVQELNMSRTPIREALTRLQQEGFLKIMSNRGIVFTELSLEERNELVDMRIAIETYSLKQSFDLINDKHIEALRQIIHQQEAAYEQNDFTGLVEHDFAFHYYLLNIVGNSYFNQMYRNARERQFTVRAGSWLRNKRELLLQIIEEHKKIVEHLNNKDIHLALQQLEDHLNSGKFK